MSRRGEEVGADAIALCNCSGARWRLPEQSGDDDPAFRRVVLKRDVGCGPVERRVARREAGWEQETGRRREAQEREGSFEGARPSDEGIWNLGSGDSRIFTNNTSSVIHSIILIAKCYNCICVIRVFFSESRYILYNFFEK